MVVDDKTGLLARQLAAHIRRAQILLAEARLVQDDSTAHDWLKSTHEWQESATNLLSARFEQAVLTEFLQAVNSPRQQGAPRRTLTAQRRAVRNGIEMLVALHSTLAGRELTRQRRATNGRRAGRPTALRRG